MTKAFDKARYKITFDDCVKYCSCDAPLTEQIKIFGEQSFLITDQGVFNLSKIKFIESYSLLQQVKDEANTYAAAIAGGSL